MTVKEPEPRARIYYGGDYNPEQWSPEIWREDVRLMIEAGVNLVSVGMFAWSYLEPRPGEFDFAWMHEVLDLLAEGDIGVDLATPTASPPVWLAAKHPQTLPVDERGNRYSYGSRQHFCISSPEYRAHAAAVVSELVREFGDHPALQMWHVHNEYACHVPYCYCDVSAAAFRRWVEQRYETVDALNDAWGTAFWSQRYGTWAEILPPRRTPTFHNPGQLLDFKRFSNEEFLSEFKAERAIIRAASPSVPVTTNFMGFFKPLDYFQWAKEEDRIATDCYSDPSDSDSPMLTAMHYDLVRSVAAGKAWMVMEQTPSRVNWREHNVAKPPGAMRAMSHQALARGSDGILFFQWRASRAGAEKFHSAMLPHAGEGTPTWREVVDLGAELRWLARVADAPVAADVAILFSWENWWAVEGPAQPANDLTIGGQLEWIYRPLYDAGVTVDFREPGDDMARYAAVIAPSLYLLRARDGERITGYVERGGAAVTTFWSGIVDEYDRVRPGAYGGPLRELLGCAIVDVGPLATGDDVRIEWDDGTDCRASFWIDLIEAEGATPIAWFASGPWKGRPAVLEHRVGEGRALYVGTRLDRSGLDALFARVPGLAEARHGLPVGIERVLRRAPGRSFEFFINHRREDVTFEVDGEGRDLIRDEPLKRVVSLEPQGVAVVERSTT